MKRSNYLILTACALVGLNSCSKDGPSGFRPQEEQVFLEDDAVAVYTLDYKAFCRANWYGIKVDY